MDNLFLIQFVLATCSSKIRTHHARRDQFTKKVLSCEDSFNSSDLFIFTTRRAVSGEARPAVEDTEQVSNYNNSRVQSSKVVLKNYHAR